MDVFLAVLFIAGAAIGYILPHFAEKLSQYKCRKRALKFEPDTRYTAKTVRFALFALNGAAWLVFGIITESAWISSLMSLIFSVAVLTAVIDLRIRLVPNELVLVLLVLGAVFQAVQFGLSGILTSLLSMIAMMLLFSAVAGIVGFSKVGAGDVKLAGAMGIILGYPGVIAGLVVMGAGFAVFAIAGIIIKKLTLKTMVPFAPFMMTGLVFALAYIAF